MKNPAIRKVLAFSDSGIIHPHPHHHVHHDEDFHRHHHRDHGEAKVNHDNHDDALIFDLKLSTSSSF